MGAPSKNRRPEGVKSFGFVFRLMWPARFAPRFCTMDAFRGPFSARPGPVCLGRVHPPCLPHGFSRKRKNAPRRNLGPWPPVGALGENSGSVWGGVVESHPLGPHGLTGRYPAATGNPNGIGVARGPGAVELAWGCRKTLPPWPSQGHAPGATPSPKGPRSTSTLCLAPAQEKGPRRPPAQALAPSSGTPQALPCS